MPSGGGRVESRRYKTGIEYVVHVLRAAVFPEPIACTIAIIFFRHLNGK